MARSWRIEFEGALYHVLSRGNDGRAVFLENDDRCRFLGALGKASKRFDLEVHAYVLMDNHYHLLIKTNRPNLSKAMQWLGATYTRQFNLRHGRNGHLFQGRFKSIVVENDAYMLQLSLYIHRNPLRAGLVQRLAAYRWSSYPAYAYGKPQPEWLKRGLILSQLQAKDRHRAYREKIQTYAGEEHHLWEALRHGLFLGTSEFVERTRSLSLAGGPDKEIPQQRAAASQDDPMKFLEAAARVLDRGVDTLRQPPRVGGEGLEDRDLLIYMLWERGLYRNREIGELFGLGYSSVSRRAHLMRARIAEDRKLAQKLRRIESQIKLRP